LPAAAAAPAAVPAAAAAKAPDFDLLGGDDFVYGNGERVAALIWGYLAT
jgi:hypothetical protein